MRTAPAGIATTVLLCASIPVSAAAQTRGIEPADYYRMTFPGDVAVSPAGDIVAFVATTIVEEENRRHREVWIQRLEEGQPVGDPRRFSDPTRESSSPGWSPDGSVISFQSERGDEPSSTWFVPVTAPGGEAYRIEGVNGPPTWSPDGRWIAYTWTEEQEEENGRAGWIAPNAITTTLDSERFDGRVITHFHYKSDGILPLQADPPSTPKQQLYVVPSEGGTPHRLTDFSVDVGQVTWSSNSETIFFSADPGQFEPEVEVIRDIYAVSRAGGEPRPITSNPGSESNPAVSPDGGSLAYVSTAVYGGEEELMVVAVDPDGTFRGEPRNLTPDWRLTPGAPAWTSDGRAIRFEASIGGNSHLFEVAASGGEVRQVTTGDRRVASVSTSKDGRVMAYTSTDAATPAEVYFARTDGTGEHRISSFNDSWLAGVTRMPAERLTWTVADGTEIEGWVVKPVGYEPGRRYPMVLKIHGGPHGAYGNTFFQTFHVLSASGFFVLYPNPRGSAGYGHDFEYATRGNWHVMDEEDFLTGVDAALERYPDIDPDRLGVSGGSYGGVSTNWLTARSDRFAAAVTSRSISNWYSWWGTSDIPNMTEFEFYGPPWEQRELYDRLSPLSYVENVTAPTLIIHSEQDWRTPMADAEQWFMSLKKLGVPVEFVRYPRSSHGLSRTGEPWLLVDRLERLRSWFVHWLIDSSPGAADERPD